MTLRIFITPKANLDIDSLFNYIAQNNTDAALQFFDAARNTIAKLAKNPGLGSLYNLNRACCSRSAALAVKVMKVRVGSREQGAGNRELLTVLHLFFSNFWSPKKWRCFLF